MRLDPNQTLEQRSLQRLAGYWKVVHHGNLIAPVGHEKTPRLAVYFRRLNNQQNPKKPEDFLTSGATVIVQVPAAELMRLPLGVVIRDCRLAFSPNKPLPTEIEAHDLALDFSDSKVRIIGRHAKPSDGGEYIIPVQNERSPTPESEGGKAHYVAVEYEGDPFGVVIPCAEIFRFFYCTSSRMAYTILSPKILDPDRYMLNPARSGVSGDDSEVVAIWLRQWMLNSDRHHLARLFFTDGAFEKAKKIFLRAVGVIGGQEHLQHALVAEPPSHGEMRLKCIYKPFVSGGRERYFVTRLVSTDWRLPFKEIHYGRDNDNERVADPNERKLLPEHGRESRPKVLEEDTEVNVLGDAPPDDSVNPIELSDADFEARFPELHRIRSPKIEKIDQSTQSKDGKRVIALASGTLVEGSGNAHDQLISTILQTQEQSEHFRQEMVRSGQLVEPPPTPIEPFAESNLHILIRDLESAITHCTNTLQTKFQVNYLPVLKSQGLLLGKVINALPTSLDGKSYAWFFRDEAKQHARPLIIVQLRYQDRVRHLIEFMGREGTSSNTSMLVLWNDQGDGLIPRERLEYAVTTCMRNKAVSLREGVLLAQYSAKRLKHRFPEEKGARHIQLIKKIFEAPNEMDKLLGEKPASPDE
ncbi:hypothetical protein [Burkholderia cepacia]|uniref:hypothetical protein n=1 Tax=Burkholderia cepacia TaxID=292 RepID=UPI002AB5F003|nr:hypothetical protein [Burkholderia cepacia]